MTEVLHIKTSAIPKLRCFDKNTLLTMNDGTFKAIFVKWNIEKLMRAKAEINISTR